MPHRNNILYRICEIKPLLTALRANGYLKTHSLLQYVNRISRMPIYMFCNAQKMCKKLTTHQTIIELPQESHRITAEHSSTGDSAAG